MPGLTFCELREANAKRQLVYRNKRGELTRQNRWTSAQWVQAVVGELGEYAQLADRIERGDVTFSEVRDRMADELADTAIYLDLLAQCAGIDLGDAVERKWNSRSRELGIGIRIGMSGRWVDK